MADDGKGGVAFIEDIADITKLKSIRGVTDNVAEAIAKSIDDLGLPSGKVDEITEFLAEQAKKADFPVDKLADDISKGSQEFIEGIVKKEGLVESWKVLIDAGVDDLANKLDDISFVDDYLKKNPGKTTEQVTSEIKSKGWQKWKDDLGNTTSESLSFAEKSSLFVKNENALLTYTRQTVRFLCKNLHLIRIYLQAYRMN